LLTVFVLLLVHAAVGLVLASQVDAHQVLQAVLGAPAGAGRVARGGGGVSGWWWLVVVGGGGEYT
jgi:hypothetical protein